MEVYNTKGVRIMYPLAFFAIMLILHNGYCSGATVLVKTNTTSTLLCDGRLDECLIEDDLELEFLMNPYVSRVLANGPQGPHPTTDSLNQNQQVFTCGHPNDPPPFRKCITPSTGNNHACITTYHCPK